MHEPQQRITPIRVFLLGLVLSFLALCPAILPWHGQYVTRGDYIEQQLPFLVEAGRIIRNGLDTYSFNTFLGAPAIGSYAFYTLGSPFVWPLALLSKSALPYGISVMAIMKHACAMLFSYLYFLRMCKALSAAERRALIGSVLYTFSSFTVVNTQFYHFTEVIAFFPLLLLGIETCMQEDRGYLPLAIYCMLNTLTNYYFMFGSALLCFLYALFRFFSPEWNGFPRLMKTAFVSALGCGLASFLLLPALFYMLQITRNGILLTLEPFSLPDLLERLRVLLMPIESNVVHAYYGDAASWSSTAAWLPLLGFAGTLTFLMFQKGNPWLKRLLILLLAFSFIPILSGLFALESNLTYTRWWYGLVLIMTLSTIYILDEHGELPESAGISHAFWICTALTLLLTLPFLIPAKVLERNVEETFPKLYALLLGRYGNARSGFPFVLLSLLLSGVSGILCFLLIRFRRRVSYRLLLLSICICSVVSYAAYIYTGDHYLLSGGDLPGNGIYTLSEIAEPTLEALRIPDESEYTRIDYCRKLRNYGLLRGASSLTSFHSLRSSYVGRFVSQAGFGYNESTTVSAPNAEAALRAFLSVREYFRQNAEDPVPDGFVYDREENGFSVYKNPNALPMGLLMTACTGPHNQPMTPESIGQVLLSAVVLTDEALVTARQRLPSLDLGSMPDWTDSVSALRSRSCDRFDIDAHGFSAHITCKESGYLVFTIPYSKEFSASVDGIKSEIIPCDYAFMSLWMEPGDHTIRFDYHTRGYKMGICLSCLSAILLCCFLLFCRHQQHSR